LAKTNVATSKAKTGQLSVRSRQRQTRIASQGYAAPTFGRGKSYLTAAHNRPKVGATHATQASLEQFLFIHSR